MIRKITIDQLRQGMFVHDLNCGWLDQRFLWTAFAVADETTLQRIQSLGVRELYIDTEQGFDVAGAQTQQEAEEELDERLSTLSESSTAEPRLSSVGKEVARAKRIQTLATSIIHGLMDDIRLGRSLEFERASPVVEEMTASIFRNQDALLGLQRIRHSDHYTFEHSVNVSILMLAFAKSLNLDLPVIKELGLGALLHDIGKILVPNDILNKPGPLTEAEFQVMRRHASDGAELLARSRGFPPAALSVVAEHHERIDGSGYPEGKCGAEISLFGQMASIVDVYDAITTHRVYHRGLEPSEALRKLLEWSTHHFDPKLVQQFIRCVGIYPVGTLVRLASDRIAVVVESSRDGLLGPVVRICFDPKRQRELTLEDLDLSDPKIGAHERIMHAERTSSVPIDIAAVLGATV